MLIMVEDNEEEQYLKYVGVLWRIFSAHICSAYFYVCVCIYMHMLYIFNNSI